MKCATPGATPADNGSKPSGRYPTYENLFYRAAKCKDTLKICQESTTAGTDGLQDGQFGFKHVAAGSSEDIVVPENYFCLTNFQ